MGTIEFHRHRRPHWWAKVRIGNIEEKLIQLPIVRGNVPLDCIVALSPGTTIQVGIGTTTRGTVVTTAIEDSAPGPTRDLTISGCGCDMRERPELSVDLPAAERLSVRYMLGESERVVTGTRSDVVAELTRAGYRVAPTFAPDTTKTRAQAAIEFSDLVCSMVALPAMPSLINAKAEYVAARERELSGVAAASGNAQRSPREINVKDHGAKGDGVTDDTEAFKRAIAAFDAADGAAAGPKRR